MWKEVTIEGDRVLGLECSGKLTKEDFEQMHAWLDRELAGLDRPALVIFMGAFEGYGKRLRALGRYSGRHAPRR